MQDREVRQAPDGSWHEKSFGTWAPLEGPSPDDFAATEQYRNDSTGLGIGQGVLNTLGGDYWAPALLGMTDNEYQAAKMQQQGDTPLSVLAGEVGTGLTAGGLTGMGAAAAGLGTAATAGTVAGTEALMGASLSPEAPLEGAAIGAALGGAGALAAPAYRAARNLDMPGMPGRGPYRGGVRAPGTQAPAPAQAAPPTPAAPAGTTSTERVFNAVEESAGGQRIKRGYPTSQEFSDMGYEMSQADDLANMAAVGDEATAAAADFARQQDALRYNASVGGNPVRQMYQQRADNFRNRLQKKLGESPGSDLTNVARMDMENRVGQNFEDFIDIIDGAPVTDDHIAALDGILAESTKTSRSGVKGFVEEIKQFAQQGNGKISGQQWKDLETRIKAFIQKGASQNNEKYGDGKELMEVLTSLIDDPALAVTDTQRALQQQAKMRWSILKVLEKPGVLKDGKINIRAFHNHLARRPGAIRNNAEGSLLREAEGLAWLQQFEPNSGTANNMNMLQQMMTNPIGTAAGAAEKVPGLNLLVPN